MRREIRKYRLVFLLVAVFVFVYAIVSLSMYLMPDTKEGMPEGIVGYWDFDGWHFFARDSSDFHNNGIIKHGTIVNQGFASFDGANDIIEVDDMDEYSISSRGFSVSFWMRVHSFDFENSYDNRYVNFLGKGDRYYPNPNQEWGFRVHDINDTERAKSVYFYVFNITGGLGIGSHTSPLTEDEWTHIVGTTDGFNTYIYENGVLVDSDPYTRYHVLPSCGDSDLFFGYRDTSGGFYSGDLDEVIIFNKNLSSQEVKTIYDLQKDKVRDQE